MTVNRRSFLTLLGIGASAAKAAPAAIAAAAAPPVAPAAAIIPPDKFAAAILRSHISVQANSLSFSHFPVKAYTIALGQIVYSNFHLGVSSEKLK